MKIERRILLVEPDREFRNAVKKTLQSSAYDIFTAHDGKEALDILSRAEFDLIISALRMPNLDGIELMAEINRARTRTPVIFLTAYGDVESYMDLMNMGAYDYLNKPVKTEKLVDTARKALGNSNRVAYASGSFQQGEPG